MGQKEVVQGGVGRITYEQEVERRMVLLESSWVSSGQRCSEAIHPPYEERGIGALEVEGDVRWSAATSTKLIRLTPCLISYDTDRLQEIGFTLPGCGRANW